MRFILQGSCQRLHIALTIALLAACGESGAGMRLALAD
jgi:hypothetical protein